MTLHSTDISLDGVVWNSLSDLDIFRQTLLYRTFSQSPFGFVDVGSLDGVHPVIYPVAGISQVSCFEPFESGYQALQKQYENHSFADLKIHPVALGNERREGVDFYVTQKANCSSLLKPGREILKRYGAQNSEVVATEKIKLQTLDSIFLGQKLACDFIKLDTQGSEYDIFCGAQKTLSEQVVAIWCEVEFFQVYENQKVFADVDMFLRQQGFSLYGLYPNYRSKKLLDRKNHDFEERLMWADAVYFKDPLGTLTLPKPLTERQRLSLILTAILTRYFDFALELTNEYITDTRDRQQIVDFIKTISRVNSQDWAQKIQQLHQNVTSQRNQAYILSRQFIDRNYSNASADYINLSPSSLS